MGDAESAERLTVPHCAIKMRGMESGALANLDHDAVIERIANGEYAAHIAPEFGVTKQALQYQIRKHPRYQQAREIGCELRLDHAMAQFDALKIPRPPLRPLPDPLATPEERAQRLAQWDVAYGEWKDGLRVSAFDLARVEAYFKSITWQAEREFPHRWGQRTQVNVTVDLGSALQAISERLQGRVIEGDAVQQETVEHAQVLRVGADDTADKPE